MSKAISDENKAYEQLIKRFPLRPIRNDKQNEQAAEICDMLLDKGDSLNPSECDYLEVLSDLIAKYESNWDDECAEMSARDLIRYLMNQNNLAQKDLIPEFGTPSRVSEFLKGERRLSLEQAKRLSERFRLNIAALIDKNDDPKSIGVPSEKKILSTIVKEDTKLGNTVYDTTYRTASEPVGTTERRQTSSRKPAAAKSAKASIPKRKINSTKKTVTQKPEKRRTASSKRLLNKKRGAK